MTMFLSGSMLSSPGGGGGSGASSGSVFSESNQFFVHALRRDSDGMLHYTKVKTTDTAVMDFHRTDGTPYPDFLDGVDYLDETTEEKTHTNHSADKYQQYRFDLRRISYFIDDDGYFVVRFGDYDYATEGPK
tara:strand:+ start:779 stop:1174 length:396 start_codon:yes stop_codon:yes gene_type:complete